MGIGKLFYWNNFPYSKDGNLKPRLFILLGKSNIFFPPIVAYLATLTSQTQHYEPNNYREKNTIVRFKKGEFNLDMESVIDLDHDIYDFILESEIQNNKDIKIIDQISNEKLKLIYEKLLLTGISNKIKNDIHNHFNRIGVTGLKKP
ncbi:MAG: hypothetical protein ACYDIA_14910 [Candidatus Humimicrobiaceae bacterium]